MIVIDNQVLTNIPVGGTIPATVFGCSAQSHPPTLYLVQGMLKLSLMLSKRIPITPCLVLHMRRIYMVENRHYNLPPFQLALHYLGKLIQTPPGSSIVLGEDDHTDLGSLDGLHKCRRYFVPSLNTVVYVGLDLLPPQSRVEMACESVAGVLTSEAREHIVLLRRRRSRSRRWRREWPFHMVTGNSVVCAKWTRYWYSVPLVPSSSSFNDLMMLFLFSF